MNRQERGVCGLEMKSLMMMKPAPAGRPDAAESHMGQREGGKTRKKGRDG